MIKIKSKKGEIGTTLTLFFAIFSILFILILYLIGIAYIVYGDLDFFKTATSFIDEGDNSQAAIYTGDYITLTISFLKSNKALIFDWAGDNCAWDNTYFEESEGCTEPAVKSKYDLLCEKIISYFGKINNQYFSFCIENKIEDKIETLVFKSGETSCTTNAMNSCASAGLGDNVNEIYFITDNGKIAKAYYGGKNE